jgi:trans-aconitate 2-methyltransferase
MTMARPVSATEWDAGAYHELSKPQREWGETVVASLELRGDETIVDLGCGTGHLTARLVERVPRGRVVAVDRSRNMLDRAREHLAPFGDRVAFVQAELPVLPGTLHADVVFSTATFHWVLDPTALFRTIARVLRPGGLLVAQCGGAGNIASLRARVEALAHDDAFAPYFVGFVEPWQFMDARLAEHRLREAGFVDVEAGLVDAAAVLHDVETYRAFIESVVVRQHLEPLPDENARGAFLDALCARAAADPAPFTLDYVRLNLRARKP